MVPAWCAAIALALSVAGQQTSKAEQEHARLVGEVTRMVQVLQLRSDSVVADVGAGSGEVTIELAQQLGRESRVYGTDINQDRLTEIRSAAAKAGLTNVIVVEGDANRTNLPDACCDALIVRHVYHHFADPPAMNASILRALKPGGRFAVMDFPPDKGPTRDVPAPKRGNGNDHGVYRDTVVTELTAAGFEIAQVVPDWTANLFLVLARKP
jgi:ubiquinone/menaquinone biosynthesis C-methylase UbiE